MNIHKNARMLEPAIDRRRLRGETLDPTPIGVGTCRNTALRASSWEVRSSQRHHQVQG